MHHVILDTNIYRKDPHRKKMDFQALEKLAKEDKVKLHLPYIVEREFQTQQSEQCKVDLNKAISGLNKISGRVLSKKTLTDLKKIKASLANLYGSVLEDTESQLVEWAKQLNANRVELCLEQAERALESYFKGTPPLTSVKVRADIPDSFLVRSIEKIANGVETLHVISEDKKVIAAFEKSEGIESYRELNSFISSKVIQIELKELDLIENIEDVKNAIIDFEKENREIELGVSDKIGESLMWQTIFDACVPDENNEATISSYGEVKDIEIDLDLANIYYYGNGKFGFDFSLEMEVYGTYYINKSDYYMMELERDSIPAVSDHNDHYFEAEEDFQIKVEGMAALTIDINKFELKNISESILNCMLEIDHISKIELCQSN